MHSETGMKMPGEEKLYYSPEAAMEAVDQGEADYCYIDNYSFQYCINKRVYKNISSIVLAESGSQSIEYGRGKRFRFGSSRDFK